MEFGTPIKHVLKTLQKTAEVIKKAIAEYQPSIITDDFIVTFEKLPAVSRSVVNAVLKNSRKRREPKFKLTQINANKSFGLYDTPGHIDEFWRSVFPFALNGVTALS